jgi:glycosyltransferase involved in cell wall biosynthesis
VLRKPRVAYFSPLPPERSGISDYSEELLPHLADHLDLTLFVNGYRPTSQTAQGHRVVDCERVSPVPQLADYDAVLYHVGNSDAHDYIYETLLHWPGLVVLHDLSIHHLIASRTVGGERKDLYLAEMRAQHGDEGAERARRALFGSEPVPWEDDPLLFPLNRRVLGQATGVLAHSRFVADEVRKIYPTLLVRELDHHVQPIPASVAPRRPGDDEELRLITAGNLNPAKRLPVVLRALAALRGRVRFRYRIVGEVKPRWDISRFVRELGLEDVVEVHGRVPKDDLYRLLCEADLCICLRHPTLGETSGIAIRSLGCGCPLVVTDAGWFAELSDEVAVKIPSGPPEEHALRERIVELARDREHLGAMSRAAQEWAALRDPASRARGYAEFVHEGGLFPGRFVGRSFHSITRHLRDIDFEYAACAARLTAAHVIEMSSWRNPPIPRRRKPRREGDSTRGKSRGGQDRRRRNRRRERSQSR